MNKREEERKSLSQNCISEAFGERDEAKTSLFTYRNLCT
jgi:hypothetical protein